MKSDIILYKLQSLSRSINRISSKISHDFITNLDSQDIVILNLQRAIQISIDIGAIVLKENKIEIPNNRSEIFTLLFEPRLLFPVTVNDVRLPRLVIFGCAFVVTVAAVPAVLALPVTLPTIVFVTVRFPALIFDVIFKLFD
jgi:hypothetical protein